MNVWIDERVLDFLIQVFEEIIRVISDRIEYLTFAVHVVDALEWLAIDVADRN